MEKFTAPKRKPPSKKEAAAIRKLKAQIPVFTTSPLDGLTKIDDLNNSHPAREYLLNRKLPTDGLYYTDEFQKWVNEVKPDTFPDITQDEPRIIIPLFYKKNLVGIQGRSLDFNNPKSVKYITVMVNDDAPKIYGLDDIKLDGPVYVTEGPFDSTFIRNAIAMCGADADVSKWGISNPVWIYDNEPRNREIVNRIERTISTGDSVVIWPSNILEKDINDMVMSGLDVQSVIESNTHSGLEAKLKFNTWKKI